ncbi:MAG: PAS domain-containing protein [Bacteroidales bacterium]|jgi:PAS domain S-box-containing protein
MNEHTELNNTRFMRKIITCSGALSIATGMIVIILWIREIYSAFAGSINKPETVSSYFFSLLFGSILLSGIYNTKKRILKILTTTVLFCFGLFSLLVFISNLFKTELFLETYLFTVIHNFGNIPLHHLSPISALLCFLISVSILIKMYGGDRLISNNLIAGTGFLALFSGFSVIIDNFSDTPFHFGGFIDPITFLSAFAFFFLGVGLISMGGFESFFLRHYTGPSTKSIVLRALIPLIITTILADELFDFIFSKFIIGKFVMLPVAYAITLSLFISWIIIRITKKVFVQADNVEAILRENEKKYRFLVENSQAIIFTFTSDGIISFASSGWTELLGHDTEQIIGKSLTDFIHDDDLERCKSTLLQLVHENTPIELSYRVSHRDGSVRWLITSIVPILNEIGKITSYQGIAKDITQIKDTDEKLKESEQRMLIVMEIIQEGVWDWHIPSGVVSHSKQWYTMLGVLPGEIDNTVEAFGDLIHPDEKSIVFQKIEELLSGKTESYYSEHRLIGKKGTIMVRDRGTIVERDTEGRPVRVIGSFIDITAVNRLEVEKNRQSLLINALLDSIPDVIFFKDINGVYLGCNPAFLDLIGKSKEEIIGKTDYDIFEKEVADSFRYYDIEMLKSLLPKHNEEWVTYPDGRRIMLDTLKTPYWGNDNQLIGILGISRDITSRKLAEQALIKSETQLKSILNDVEDVVWSLSWPELNVHYISPSVEKMFGYSAQEFALNPMLWKEIVHPDDVHLSDIAYEQLIKNGSALRECRIIKTDGSTVWISDKSKMFYDEHNKPFRVDGIIHDLTHYKQTENEIKKISTRLSMATSIGGIGVWEYEIPKNELYWDDQMYVLYGINESDFSGAYEAWVTGLHPEDKERGEKEIQMAIRGEKEFDTEFRVIWPNGSIHSIKAIAIVKRDTTGKALSMIGTNWEITEQKENEAILLNAINTAEAANQAKSTFLANMSHEIRTPLNAIIGFSKLLSREQFMNTSQKEFISSINSAGEHLLTLINDILELSKLEAKRAALNPVNIDLLALLTDIHYIFKEQAQSKQLRLELEADEHLPRFILVDEGKLRRIFINLIGNAIKYTDEGGITVRVKVENSPNGKCVLFAEVQDSGQGISENEFEKLFNLFEQTSSGIKKGSGTGLGLALSRELAILMGGDISVSSEIGKGSVFSFSVEINTGSEQNFKEIKSHVIKIRNPKQSYRILIADDKEDNLKLVVNLLNMVGFETKIAYNGQDAITKFEQWNPDLILMDLRMPVMDGYEASKRIKSSSKGKNIPIIALTASSFDKERKSLIHTDFQGYIRKPFRENDLFGTIGEILGIEYLYEPVSNTSTNYQDKKHLIEMEIANQPEALLVRLLDAIAGADIHLIIELIHSIHPDNKILTDYLLHLANNYQYDALQKLLTKKN